MRLTAKLKGWLKENMSVPETASDEEYLTAAHKAIDDGKLTQEKLAELTAEPKAEDKPDPAIVAMAQLTAAVQKIGERLDDVEKKREDDKFDRLAKLIDEKTTPPATPPTAGGDGADTPTPAKLFGGTGTGEDSASKPRHIKAVERYDTTKQVACYRKAGVLRAGQPAEFEGEPVYSPSRKDLAVIGASFKMLANLAGRAAGMQKDLYPMTDHDKELWEHAKNDEPWTGAIGARGKQEDTGKGTDICRQYLTDHQKVALLDDATSGGQEVVPSIFEDAIITYPVLHGELFPNVDVRSLPRGSTMESATMTSPSLAYKAEGTAIDVYDATSMVAAFDINIYPVTGSIEYGNDFAADSPVNIGAEITRLYGEQHLLWLDNQIANGDGTTEPEGLLLPASVGPTDIGNPNGGANAAPQVVDFETLIRSVPKQYRRPDLRSRTGFVFNDTSYFRARGIKVGTNDVRRVFGMDHQGYMLLEFPCFIQNNIANTKAGFFVLPFYRMYRRQGLEVRVETGGRTLALANKTLVVVRARYGGKLTDASAGAYSDNWQT